MSAEFAVIGSGAVGGFYGVLLARAGFNVHFLLRSEYAAVAANGLRVESPELGELRLDQVNAYQRAEDMPPCDWVLVGTKATSNVDIAPLIAAVAKPGANVLVLQNGLGVEDQLRALLPSSLHLLGGLCWVAAQRSAPGVIEHVALGHIDLGYHSGQAAAGEQQWAILTEAAGLLSRAGIKAQPAKDLLALRWRKLVWNITYNGLSVLLQSGTRGLLGQPEARALSRDLMEEVIAAATACGHVQPEGLVDRMVALTESIPDYLPSMYVDFAERRPMELEALFVNPLAAARRAGCAMPKVEALYQSLAFVATRNSIAS